MYTCIYFCFFDIYRTDSLESVPSEIKISRNTQNSDLNEESNDSNQILGEENCDIDLFIPLVQLCANQRLYQVIF